MAVMVEIGDVNRAFSLSAGRHADVGTRVWRYVYCLACFLTVLTTSCGVHKKRETQPAQTYRSDMAMPTPTKSLADADTVVAEFSPFTIDRADGFYEVVAYSGTYPFTDVQLAEYPIVSKKEIKKAKADVHKYQPYPVVSIELSAEGSRLFEEATAAHIGKPIAIVVGGKVVSMPTVQDRIAGGKIQIVGSFSFEEAQEMAKILSK